MPIKNWSITPGNNISAPPFGAPESSTKLKDMNDLIRQVMADTRYLAASSTVASAATTDLGASDETILTISGVTSITSFGTVSAGIWKLVTFSGALTLTHNATSLILLGGANRTTVAGDCGLYVSLGGGNWKEYFYSPVSTSLNQPLDAELTTLAGMTAQQATDHASLSAYIGTLLNDPDASTAQSTLGISPFVKTILDDATGDAVFATMGATKSLTTRGYQKLPSGLIIQWAAGDAAGTISFPVAFPTACFAVIANAYDASTPRIFATATIINNTSFTLATYDTNPTNIRTGHSCYWIAVGH